MKEYEVIIPKDVELKLDEEIVLELKDLETYEKIKVKAVVSSKPKDEGWDILYVCKIPTTSKIITSPCGALVSAVDLAATGELSKTSEKMYVKIISTLEEEIEVKVRPKAPPRLGEMRGYMIRHLIEKGGKTREEAKS